MCLHEELPGKLRARITEVLADEYAPARAYELGGLTTAIETLDALIAKAPATVAAEDSFEIVWARLSLNEELELRALAEKIGMTPAPETPRACPCTIEGDDARELAVRIDALVRSEMPIPPYELSRLAVAIAKATRLCEAPTKSTAAHEQTDAALARLTLDEVRRMHALLVKASAYQASG